jgi:DNA-binding response OmpR family regulator
MRSNPMPTSTRQPLCLIVEDDPQVGLDLADALEEAGFFVAGPLTSGQSALDWLARFSPDVAVVAPVLKDGVAGNLIGELHKQGVPFLVYPANTLSESLRALASASWLNQTGSMGDIIQALMALLC